MTMNLQKEKIKMGLLKQVARSFVSIGANEESSRVAEIIKHRYFICDSREEVDNNVSVAIERWFTPALVTENMVAYLI